MIKRLVRAGLITGLLFTLYAIGYGYWLTSQGWRFLFPAAHGEQVGEFEGVAVYGNNGSNVRGEFGLQFECVELVNRFYATRLDHRNMTQKGNADDYLWHPDNKGLVAYPNGSDVKPMRYDIVVFDGGPNDGNVGHVVIASKVTDTTVAYVQQNAVIWKLGLFARDLWQDSLPLTEEAGRWTISQGRNRLPVAGWSRPAKAE